MGDKEIEAGECFGRESLSFGKRGQGGSSRLRPRVVELED